jgi:flagellar P-ring protein precursor FlgI
MKSLLSISIALFLITAMVVAPVEGATRLKDICRVKGQESNTIRGLGLVVGLNGTGDGGTFLPAMRSLATAMSLMGNRLDKNPRLPPLIELKDSKNVALVTVTATIPPGGARQGDQVDCFVSSIGSAKSLAGGELFMTPLQGPLVNSDRIFAFAQGPIHIEDPRTPTRVRVHKGCRLEEDLPAAFTKDDTMTLVLEESHADFELAQEISELINSQFAIQSSGGALATALDTVNIMVKIPEQYRDEPVAFVSQVLALTVNDPPAEARVVINEAAGSIVIGADVEIGPAVISHKNIVVETGTLPTTRFVPVDTAGSEPAKLRALVETLNAVKVPTSDVIEIIKGLKRNGKLYGKLIVE